jgi:hypothetical protein
MRDHAAEAVAIARGRSRADLDGDRLLNLALVRLVEVFGEAAPRVPPEVRSGTRRSPGPRSSGLGAASFTTTTASTSTSCGRS